MSPSNPTPTPRFLTLPQVSEQLACSNAQTYALVRSGDLAAIKIGGRGQWRIAHDLQDYITKAYADTRAFIEAHPFGTNRDDAAASEPE